MDIKSLLNIYFDADILTSFTHVQAAIGSDRGSYSHLKRTVPKFVWKQTETTSSAGSWLVRLFGPHPSVIAVFTPAQTICTKRGNKLDLNSIEPKKTGVNTP